jgi:hypothetical protein
MNCCCDLVRTLPEAENPWIQFSKVIVELMGVEDIDDEDYPVKNTILFGR